jgi:hypothetical protein
MSASFEESCARFSEFLADNGYAHAPVWITPKDVLLGGQRLLYVKLPIPEGNQKRARTLFDTAMKEQSGVSFKTVCETDGATLCTVWVPADDSERERAMCSKTDLKMSLSPCESRVRGKEVRSGLLWRYLQLHYRKSQTLKDQLFWG